MCIAAVLFDAGRGEQRTARTTRGGASTVTASAAVLCVFAQRSKLVQVVADSRDLAGALALFDSACRRGPRSRPRHRLAQQRGRRDARRLRLLVPSGVLRRGDPGGDQGGALSHGPAVDGVRGAAKPACPAARAATQQAGGSEGGRSTPSPAATLNVAWAGLRTLRA